MQEQLRRRLEELKKQFEAGQARLRELETEQTYVRETLLRISGAIQVLEETLADGSESGEAPPPTSPEAGAASGTTE